MTDLQLMMILTILNVVVTFLHIILIKYDIKMRLDIVEIEKKLSQSNFSVSKSISSCAEELNKSINKFLGGK